MRKFMEEFRAFALRGNVMDMAVGVIIGGAFSGIVTSLTDNFINPILNLCTGHEMYSLQDAAGFVSSFLSSVVNFVIMAFILFCLMKVVNKATELGKKKEEEALKEEKLAKAESLEKMMEKMKAKQMETETSQTVKVQEDGKGTQMDLSI